MSEQATSARPEVPDVPEVFVRTVMRGGGATSTDWTWPDDESSCAAFLVEAARHHVEPLLAWQLRNGTASLGWPVAVVETLDERLREQTVREALVQRELTSVFDALGRAGVRAILMKGAALAYTIYPAPALRPRNDTDLLIRHADLDRTTAALEPLGYGRENYLTGERISHQALFRKIDRHGLKFDLDVHWKISNRPLFEDMLMWNDLDRDAAPVPALGSHARAIGPLHALTLACVHPVAHHGNTDIDRLRWVYDVHLLASRLTERDFSRFVDLAIAKRISTIARRALTRSLEYFGTMLPESVFDALRATTAEPSAEYLSPTPWRGDVRLSDFKTTRGLRKKARFVRELVIPDAGYMREAYGMSNEALLAPMYVYRVVRGSWKLLERLVS